MHNFKLALIGRSNVGKSTLFNRLVRANCALTYNYAGVTRDIKERVISIGEYSISLLDSPGMFDYSEECQSPILIEAIEKKLYNTIQAANLILFITDGKVGITPTDRQIGRILRKNNKDVILVINKSEGLNTSSEGFNLGFRTVYISAEHNLYINDLLSIITQHFNNHFKKHDTINNQYCIENKSYNDNKVNTNSTICNSKNRKVNTQEINNISGNKELTNIQNNVTYDNVGIMQENNSTNCDAGTTDNSKNKGNKVYNNINLDRNRISNNDNVNNTENNNKSDNNTVYINKLNVDECSDANKINKNCLNNAKNYLKLAFVGRPNVGKSTLINQLLGRDQQLVADFPGLTRESSTFDFTYKNQLFKIIDTPGVRKKAKICSELEQISVKSALRAYRNADAIILVIDAVSLKNGSLERQDLILASHILQDGKLLVIALNKVDQTPYNENEQPKFLIQAFRNKLSQNKQLPFVFVSAKNNVNLDKLLNLVMINYNKYKTKINTSKLNNWLAAINQLEIMVHFKLKYITQIGQTPPTFLIFKSHDLRQEQEQFVLNHFKQYFNLQSVIVKLIFKKNK